MAQNSSARGHSAMTYSTFLIGDIHFSGRCSPVPPCRSHQAPELWRTFPNWARLADDSAPPADPRLYFVDLLLTAMSLFYVGIDRNAGYSGWLSQHRPLCLSWTDDAWSLVGPGPARVGALRPQSISTNSSHTHCPQRSPIGCC